MSQDGRYRDFCFVAYPESMPIDWIDRINKYNLEWCFCLHDKDTNEFGEVKKEHVHGILHFDGKKSKEQVSALFIMCGVAKGFAGYKDGTANTNLVTACQNKRGAVRYLIHKDDLDKWQYNKSDIRAFGGFDIEKYFDYSSSEELSLFKDIYDFCEDNSVFFYYQLIKYAYENESDTWLPYIINNGYAVREYLKSKQLEREYIKKCYAKENDC